MQGVQRGIVFTKEQMKWLQKRAARLGISLSEVIRRIVDEKRENKDAKLPNMPD